MIVRVLHENKEEDEDSLEINPIQEITDAYLPMKQVFFYYLNFTFSLDLPFLNLFLPFPTQVDVLDLTDPGTAVWEAALEEYETCIDRVETQITLQLRDKLGAAKNATEMFRVCSKFNALFFRPRIRSAVQEYQNELIAKVKADIERLHQKYKARYGRSQASRLSKLRFAAAVVVAVAVIVVHLPLPSFLFFSSTIQRYPPCLWINHLVETN